VRLPPQVSAVLRWGNGPPMRLSKQRQIWPATKDQTTQSISCWDGTKKACICTQGNDQGAACCKQSSGGCEFTGGRCFCKA
jgi:hypothetical protein